MQPFVSVTGVAAPLLIDDVNTDQVAPTTPPRGKRPDDYKALYFWRWRLGDGGADAPDFVLNRPQFRDACILVGGRNFGCGSSRESAVWSLLANGIRCVVARGFGEYFRENCLQNGVLPLTLPDADADRFDAAVVAIDGRAPITIDLAAQEIRLPDGATIAFTVPAAERAGLLEGLDNIGMTLKHEAAIAAWEKRMREEEPWLQALHDSRERA